MRNGLVGRSVERAAIAALMQRARGGNPQPLLITGAAGSGKTTLLHHVIETGRSSGFRVLLVEPDPIDVDVPYGAMRLALGRLEHGITDGAAEAKARRAFATLVSTTSPTSRTPPRDRTAAVPDPTTELLESWAFRSPVLVAVDDLHLADAATARLVTSLMRQMRDQRVFVVAATRNEPELVADVAEDCHRQRKDGKLDVIELGPFSDAELADLVEVQLGARPRESLVDVVRDRSGGVPFYAVELLAALAESGSLVDSDGFVDAVESVERALPQRLTTAVIHRVFRLGPDARGVAAAVAVLGEVELSRVPVVASVTHLSSAQTMTALEGLSRAGVLVLDGSRYRFAHGIVRDALYDDVGPALRRRWHDEVARALVETRAPGETRATLEIAGHLRRAAGGPNALAARTFVEAGDLVAPLDTSAAAGWYRDALTRLDPDDPAVADTQLRLSRVLDLSSQHAEAARIAAAALRSTAPGAGRARATMLAAHASSATGDFARARELSDLALADPETRSTELLLQRAHLELWDERLVDARRYRDEALALGVHGHRGMFDAIDMHLEFVAGHFAGGTALANQIEQGLDRLSPGAQPMAQMSLAIVSAFNLDPARALSLAEATPPSGPMVAWFRALSALAYLRQGRLAEAIESAEVAQAAAGAGDVMLCAYVYPLIVGYAERGDLVSAERAWSYLEAAPFKPAPSITDCAVSFLLSVRGDHVGADATLERAERHATSVGRVNQLAMVLAHRVDSRLAAGDRVGARLVNDRLQALPHDGTTVAMTMFQLLARALANDDATAAEQARDHAVAHGLGLDAARALGVVGALQDDADMLLEALDELGRIGAIYRQRAVAKELRRLGRRVPSHRRAGNQVSPVEREVAALVAQGMTNRQIAARMNLSPKTVEVYLSRIYRKTGCATRVELAVAVNEGRLS